MSDNHFHEQIDQWLDGELTGEALAEFERRMQAEPAFANEVALQKSIHDALSETDVFALENTLLDIRQQLPAAQMQPETRVVQMQPGARDVPGAKVVQMNARRFPLRRVLALAAGVALLVTAFFLFQKKTSGDAGLFAANYQPYPVYLTSRSDAAERQAALENGIKAYQSGNYAEALAQFKPLLDADSGNQPLRFYVGICLLETGDLPGAIAHFQQVSQAGDSQYDEAAQWYLALAFLKNKQAAEAKTVLESLVKRQGDFAERAGKLLIELGYEG